MKNVYKNKRNIDVHFIHMENTVDVVTKTERIYTSGE